VGQPSTQGERLNLRGGRQCPKVEKKVWQGQKNNVWPKGMVKLAVISGVSLGKCRFRDWGKKGFVMRGIARTYRIPQSFLSQKVGLAPERRWEQRPRENWGEKKVLVPSLAEKGKRRSGRQCRKLARDAPTFEPKGQGGEKKPSGLTKGHR